MTDIADILRYAVPVGIVSVQAIMGWVLWSLKREFVCRKEWANMTRAHSELEKRVVLAEQELQHIPDDKAVHGLELEIQGLRGEMKILDVKVSGVRELLDRFVNVVERQENWLKYGRGVE